MVKLKNINVRDHYLFCLLVFEQWAEGNSHLFASQQPTLCCKKSLGLGQKWGQRLREDRLEAE